MRAGKMDRAIEIRRTTETVNDYGTVTETDTLVAAVRAQLLEASNEEFRRAYGSSSDVVTVFRIRWLEGITNDDRVIYEGRRHDVVATKEIGRRRGLELRTIARDV